MKRLKKFVTLFTLAAVCFAIPGLGKITVKAAEPTTYVLNYSDSSSEWRYKEASSWSAEVQDRELYYLQQNIKDGDYIVIDNRCGEQCPGPQGFCPSGQPDLQEYCWCSRSLCQRL